MYHNVNTELRQTDMDINILGYCDKTEEEIKGLILKGQGHVLGSLGGEYTLVCTSSTEVVIVTSVIGALHYFYYYDGNRFEHGADIISITKKLAVNWEWDWESVGDLCEQENLTENRTLHKHIKRVPPSSILVYKDKLTIHTKNFIDSIKDQNTDPVEAVEIFNTETRKWVSRYPYLSLSGGFDSRVILSSMLLQQIYPTLVTLGNEDSSDIRVAQEISKRYGLNHIRVSLDHNELIERGEHIANITNGSKPACHWHTYLYPKKAGIPGNESFFVGTLGEFARSYYFDKGVLSLALNDGGRKVQEQFWKMKLLRHRTFTEREYRYLSEALIRQIDTQGLKTRARRNAKLSEGTLLSGGTRYYLEQRVPNFYANGIRMYNDSGQWRSPFHNTEWLRLVWGLADHWKLGSNWHRLAIQRNYPSLLSFPEEKGFAKNRMLSKAPPLYWMPIMQRMKYQSYDLSSSWYKEKDIESLILDSHKLYNDIIDRKGCELILKEHQNGSNRVRAISFILTILFFKKSLHTVN